MSTEKDLASRVAYSALWKVLRTGGDNVLRFTSFIILARYLTPDEFGVFAVASVFIAISGLLSSGGMGDVLIREEVLDEELKNTVFWANLGAATILCLALLLLSPVIAAAYDDSRMVLVIGTLALTLVLPPFWSMGAAMSFRKLNVKKLELIGFLASASNSLAAIAIAVTGGGLWALVAGSLSHSLVSLFLTRWYFPWTPRLQFSASRLKSILSFGLNLMASRILQTLIIRLQELLASLFLSMTAVGQYRVGTRFMEMITDGIVNPISGVGLAAFSRVRAEPERLSNAYQRMIAVASIVYVPAMVGFAAVAEHAVPLIFGQHWLPSVPVVQILSLLAPSMVMAYFHGPMLSAVGRSDVLRNITLVQLLGTLAFSLVGVQFGIVGLAIAYVLRSYSTLPLQMYWLWKASGVRPSGALLSALKPSFAAAIMALALRLLEPTLIDYVANPIILLTIMCVGGGMIYVAIMITLFRRFFFDHLGELKKAFARPQQPEAIQVEDQVARSATTPRSS